MLCLWVWLQTSTALPHQPTNTPLSLCHLVLYEIMQKTSRIHKIWQHCNHWDLPITTPKRFSQLSLSSLASGDEINLAADSILGSWQDHTHERISHAGTPNTVQMSVLTHQRTNARALSPVDGVNLGISEWPLRSPKTGNWGGFLFFSSFLSFLPSFYQFSFLSLVFFLSPFFSFMLVLFLSFYIFPFFPISYTPVLPVSFPLSYFLLC